MPVCVCWKVTVSDTAKVSSECVVGSLNGVYSYTHVLFSLTTHAIH